jgi:predicted nucleotidyltransferase
MDLLDEGLLDFWKVLNNNLVRYIMVGGFAVTFNGYNRVTEDIDLFLDDNLENRKKLRQAFKELKYGDFASLETMQFAPGWTNFYISHGIELDIMTSMKGLEDLSFDECLKHSNIADLDGIKVPFLHINHLIANKKAVNRPKDQVDVMELEKITKYLQENDKKG